MSGAIAMGTNKITGVGDPTAQDAATKAYTDSILGSATSAADSAAAAATSASNAATSASNAASSATSSVYNVSIIAYGAFNVADVYTQAQSDARYTQQSNNLSDLDNAATALTNLGLTATATELNTLDGVTATTAELNILDGVTATTTELNYVDGVTSNIQTQIDNIDALPSQTGNNGLFLTTDGSTASWAEAGGGAWELLATATPSSSASIDFTSIPTGYLTYMVVGYVVPSTSSYLTARFYVNGTLASSSGYYYNIMDRLQRGSSSAVTYDINGDTDQLYIVPAQSNRRMSANNACYFSLRFVPDTYSSVSSNTVPFFTESQFYDAGAGYFVNASGGGCFFSFF
jgi:hypothetical protein